MPQRNVASNFTFEQQRVEINNLAQDFWTQKGTVDTAASTYLKHDGSNDFTGQTLAVPNAFTINSNSGNGTVTISGNLDVTGTTTTVNSANLEVTDKNILIAKGSTSDAQADGAGITIDSATDITFNFVDDRDALVSSIGLEGSTFLKAPYGQFIGSGTPTGGQGVEINAPDANTGQIISYDRGSTAYKELRVKGSSVGIYGGTSNALVGSFSSTGLSVTGTLSATGGSFTGNVNLSDNVLLGLGNSDDLLIHHTGSTGYIKGQNGNLYIQSDQVVVIGNQSASNAGLKFTNGGAVELFHDGANHPAAKLQTTTTGINVTGLAVNGTNATFTNSASCELTLISNPANDSGVYFNNGTSNAGAITYNHASNEFKFRINSNKEIKTSSTGHLGVGSFGTGTPLKRLHLIDTGDVGIMLQTTAAVDNNESWEITCGANASNNADLVFQTRANDGTGGNVGMRICHDGEVLIGTSTKNASDRFTIIDPGNAFMSLRSDAAGDGVSQHLDFIVTEAERSSTNMVGSIRAQIPTGSTAGGTLKGELSFWTNEGNSITEQLTIKDDGDVLPGSDNAQDLGSSSLRWANVYTGDMHLNNMNTGGNEVDGSEGHWTMQEGSDDLFLINRNTGKKYKFNLTEVS